MIDAYLHAFVRRRRRLAVVRAFAWAVATGVACTLLSCTVDRLVPLHPAVRMAVLSAIAVGAIAILARPVSQLFRRVDPVLVAATIERQHPAFAHRLVTVASPGEPSELQAAVERDVIDLIAATGPARVPRRPAAVATAVACAAIALYAGLWRWPWLDLRDLTRRLVHPTASIAAVTSTRLTVRPGATDVVDGKPLAVTANVAGAIGSDGVVLHVSDDGGATWTDRRLTPAAGGYAVTLEGVDRDLRYTVSAGDAVSPPYDVRVRRVPGVVAVHVRLDYPAALHRQAATTNDLSIAAPAGTTATVEVVATIPLARATLSVGSDRIDMSATADPRVRRAQFTVRRDERIALQLTSTDGVPSASARAARVHVQRDSLDALPGFEQQQRAYRDALRRQ